MTHKVIYFDIEADALLLHASKVWCICTEDLGTGEKRQYGPDRLKDAVAYLRTADRVAAHNGVEYDKPVIQRVLKAELPPLIDTLKISRLIYSDQYSNPVGGHSLRDWGLFLGVPKQEYTGGFDKFSEEMLGYCDQDVSTGVAVYRYQMKRVGLFGESVKLEHEVAEIIWKQHVNGVTIDKKATQRLLEVTSVERARVLDELQQMFPPKIVQLKTKTKTIAFNPNSGDQIAASLIAKYGWKPTVLTDKGKPKTDKKTMATLALVYPEARKIAEFRVVDDRASSAQTWLDSIDAKTGRLHHSVNTNGTVTGRMAHSSPNINAPKVKMSKDGKPLIGAAGGFGWECRSCFTPRPGWTQVGADASGLELRMLASYLEKYDGGDYVKVVTTGDVHATNQKAAGLPSRDFAKVFIYKLIYGAGNESLGYGVPIDERMLEDSRKAYRKMAKDRYWGRILREIGPARAKLWCSGYVLRDRFVGGIVGYKELMDAVASDAENLKYIILPDGRRVPVRSKHAALNTKLQGSGAVVMKGALVIRNRSIEKTLKYWRDWADMLNVHDEWQSEARTRQFAEHIGKESVKAIEAAGQHFNLACPLTGEYKVGHNWAECH